MRAKNKGDSWGMYSYLLGQGWLSLGARMVISWLSLGQGLILKVYCGMGSSGLSLIALPSYPLLKLHPNYVTMPTTLLPNMCYMYHIGLMKYS